MHTPYRAEKVIAKPLDEILKELGINLSRRSVILIDVEGAEMEVLRGAVDTLSKSKPRVIMELHEGEESTEIHGKAGYIVTKPSKHFIIAKKS